MNNHESIGTSDACVFFSDATTRDSNTQGFCFDTQDFVLTLEDFLMTCNFDAQGFSMKSVSDFAFQT